MGDQKKDLPPSFQPSQARQRPSAREAKPVRSRRVSQERRNGVNRRSVANDRPQHGGGGRPTPTPESPRRKINARESVLPRTPSRGGYGGDNERAQLPPSYVPRNRRERTQDSAARPARRELKGAHVPTRSPATSYDQATYPAVTRGRSAEFAREAAAPSPLRPPRRRRKHPLRRAVLVIVVLLILVLAWPLGLLWWASSKINHVEALSDSAATAGTTYLLTGSDERDDDSAVQDSTEGRRSDTIILLHKAENGQTSLVSLPRDTWTEIPGYGNSKLNASYAWGGEKLLVQTVENLTGLHVDHFVEVGMGGFTRIVDAVDGIELCLDYAVDDPSSGLTWPGGCHHADGDTALAFARMRYADPQGDIGRAARQRQVMSAVLDNALSRDTVINPVQQVKVAGSGAAAVTTDPDTSAFDLGKIALGVRKASKDGLMGAPPISNPGLPTAAGLAVELDPEKIDDFFQRLRDGALTPGDFSDNE